MTDNRNYFKSTEIRGNFYNKNDVTNSINAYAEYDGKIRANDDIDIYGDFNMKANVNTTFNFSPLKSVYIDSQPNLSAKH
jgi:hypothetical protein